MNRPSLIFPVLVLFFSLLCFSAAEEGMIPLSEIDKLDLEQLGFKLEAAEIFNPDGTSISDAIVKLNGCTGSFVSAEGLILTNHHCAFEAVQAASCARNDYLKDGFLAPNREQEIEAKGYTVRITESYRDVSEEVLKAAEGISDFTERHKALDKKRKEIVARVESDNPAKRAEVAEMFSGQTYVLFIYTYLKDVRMVYIPPRSIGEFGGDIDNWEWPRHNADFSFLRAYCAPDGSPAGFSKENVPYKPKKHLTVSAQGVDEEDFVFLLGYPGTTYRHRTSHYLSFEQEVRMPYVVQWYQWLIQSMEEISIQSRDVALKHTSKMKRLANTEKNYRGKLLGMQRLDLVKQKRTEEGNISDLINKNSALSENYSTTLAEIGKIFEQRRASFERESILRYLSRNVTLFGLARTAYKGSIEREKDDLDRESSYMNRNWDNTKKRGFIRQADYYEKTDRLVLKELLQRASRLPANQRFKSLDNLFDLNNPNPDIDAIIDKAFKNTKLHDRDFLTACFDKSTTELEKLADPILNWAAALQADYDTQKEVSDERSGAMSKLAAQWSEMRKEYFKGDFIPDANSTFRLTYGHIRGYSPADAVYKYPLTTLTGVIEKTTGIEPFITPQKIIDLHSRKDYGRFKSKQLNNLPVGILYDMDTTGGNSGSPVMNARGELVGLNFDRAFEATINDYAWSASYSRSIGVDIRYVLWIAQKVAGANYLLQEMGVETN